MNYWTEKQRADRLVADLQRAWDDFQEQVRFTTAAEARVKELEAEVRKLGADLAIAQGRAVYWKFHYERALAEHFDEPLVEEDERAYEAQEV